MTESWISRSGSPRLADKSFADWVAAKGESVFVFGYRDELDLTVPVTYAEMAVLTSRVAAGLHKRGLREGDIVSVQLPNWHEFLALYLACSRLGLILNPISPVFRKREVTEIIQRLDSSLLVTATRHRGFDYEEMCKEVVAASDSNADVFAVGPEPGSGSFYESFVDAHEHLPNGSDRVSDLDAPAEIQFTSGTTGRPKAVVHTPRTIHFGMSAFPGIFGLDSSDVIHMPGSFGHQTGFLFGCAMPVAFGMTVVLQDRWNPSRMLSLVAEHGVTTTSGATPFILDMCEAAGEMGVPASLRWVRSGGAPIPSSLARRVKSDLGADLISSWGMTENGICAISRLGDSIEKVSSTDGMLVPWTEGKIVDDDGHELPSGSPGRLLVRGPSQCLGYRQDDGTIVIPRDSDSWFDTGDVGSISGDGYLRITGRRKELIIRGGENIPIIELEQALGGLPSVQQVALVGLPDERLGEIACAVIVPSEKGPPTIDEIKEWLEAAGFSKHYWPERLVVRDALPVTSSGKIRRTELKQSILGATDAKN